VLNRKYLAREMFTCYLVLLARRVAQAVRTSHERLLLARLLPGSTTISATDEPFASFSVARSAGRPKCFPCYLASSIPAKFLSRLFSRSSCLKEYPDPELNS
jgi:hypothetical protein